MPGRVPKAMGHVYPLRTSQGPQGPDCGWRKHESCWGRRSEGRRGEGNEAVARLLGGVSKVLMKPPGCRPDGRERQALRLFRPLTQRSAVLTPLSPCPRGPERAQFRQQEARPAPKLSLCAWCPVEGVMSAAGALQTFTSVLKFRHGMRLLCSPLL